MIAQPAKIPMAELSSVIFFVLPMIAIIYQYVEMGIAVKRTTLDSFGEGSVHRNRRQIHQSNQIVKMLSFVVVGFFLCWCPFHTQRLLSVYLKDYDFFDEMNYWMYIASGVFYYFSSTVNPILYNVMSDRMRKAFKEVICGVKRKGKKRTTSSRTTTNDTSEVYVPAHTGKMNKSLVHFFSSGQWKISIMNQHHEVTLTTSLTGETSI
nr:unnamed protein product [Callosobruchus analis]